MGQRIRSTAPAGDSISYGARWNSLRKAACPAQEELATQRGPSQRLVTQVLQLLDAFIECGQFKRKMENHS